MGPVSVVRRVWRSALVLLLVAVLAAVGVSAPLSASAVSAVVGDADAGVAVGGVRVDAMAPARAAGRLLAEPSLVSVQGPGDGVPCGPPCGLPLVDLVVLGESHAIVAMVPGVAAHGLAGVRAPPA